MENLKKHWLTAAHAAVLLIGAALFIWGTFYNTIWFDEAYTVGLINNLSFSDMIRVAADDVHPHLYYILLKIFSFIFGGSLQSLRFFSVIGTLLTALLGFTHIRRDFGAKTGFWFSFVTVFLNGTFVYALQIRMYSWAAFFTALCAIYAYRLSEKDASAKNRILFAVFAVAAAYTHYFALFTIAIINLLLLVRTIRKKQSVKAWFITGIAEFIAYLPGLLIFLAQTKSQTNTPSWREIKWPDLVFDLASYHLIGDGIGSFASGTLYSICGAIFLALYILGGFLIYRRIKQDGENGNAAKWSLFIYFGVVLFTLTLSLFWVVYFVRYTVVMLPLLVFPIAYYIAGCKLSLQKAAAALTLLAIFIPAVCILQTNRKQSSFDYVEAYFEDKLEADDCFIFENMAGYNIAVMYPERTSYYYNGGGWDIEDAYKAFGSSNHVIRSMDIPELNHYTGRIWVINDGPCYDYLMSLGDCRELLSDYVCGYKLVLLEKGA